MFNPNTIFLVFSLIFDLEPRMTAHSFNLYLSVTLPLSTAILFVQELPVYPPHQLSTSDYDLQYVLNYSYRFHT